jgi:hypothetical protein
MYASSHPFLASKGLPFAPGIAPLHLLFVLLCTPQDVMIQNQDVIHLLVGNVHVHHCSVGIYCTWDYRRREQKGHFRGICKVNVTKNATVAVLPGQEPSKTRTMKWLRLCGCHMQAPEGTRASNHHLAGLLGLGYFLTCLSRSFFTTNLLRCVSQGRTATPDMPTCPKLPMQGVARYSVPCLPVHFMTHLRDTPVCKRSHGTCGLPSSHALR